MRSLNFGRMLIAMVAIGAALTGCSASPRGVTIPPGADDLAPCLTQQISIDELSAMGKPGCDLAGTALTFPDEESVFAVGPPGSDGAAPILIVPAVGSVVSQGDDSGLELLIVNGRVPGVGVAAIDGERLLRIWATSDAALDLQRQQLAVENVDLP